MRDIDHDPIEHLPAWRRWALTALPYVFMLIGIAVMFGIHQGVKSIVDTWSVDFTLGALVAAYVVVGVSVAVYYYGQRFPRDRQ